VVKQTHRETNEPKTAHERAPAANPKELSSLTLVECLFGRFGLSHKTLSLKSPATTHGLDLISPRYVVRPRLNGPSLSRYEFLPMVTCPDAKQVK
jgi:hypothetical protein